MASSNDDLIRRLCVDPEYRIEADGNIWTTRNEKGHKTSVWRLKAQRFNRNYYEIRYKGVTLQVHRIMYQKHVGNLRCDLEVNHKDRDTRNRLPSNLEMVKPATNCRHRSSTLPPPMVGRDVGL